MSIPRNHHYLSQVLLKKFLDEQNILYSYSKKEKRYSEKEYSRFDFAEKDLNSKIDSKGNIDHITVEENLNKNFESGFNKHYNRLINALETEDYKNLTRSLKYLIRLGIIGDLRTPEHQIETQNIIFDTFKTIYDIADDKLKNELIEFQKKTSKVKNKIAVDFNEICDKIINLMGETIYSVFKAEKNHYFFLPDNTAVVIREQLEPNIYLDGQLLLNENRPISTIIFPINSNTIIVAQSTKKCTQKNNGIYQFDEEAMIKYNKMFIDFSRDKIICKNNLYLKTFIKKHLS